MSTNDALTSNQLLNAAKALCELMPTGDALRHFHAGAAVRALREAIECSSDETTAEHWIGPLLVELKTFLTADFMGERAREIKRVSLIQEINAALERPSPKTAGVAP